MIYVIFIAGFVVVCFINDHLVMLFIYALLTFVMAILISLSMERIKKYLAFLEVHGLRTANKTMFLQVFCLALLAPINMTCFFTELKFYSECDDDIMAPSLTGTFTRLLNWVAILLWRTVTVTVLIFFARYAKPLKVSDQ